MSYIAFRTLLLCGSAVAGATLFSPDARAQNATANNLINSCNPSQNVTTVTPSNPATSTVSTCLVGGGSTLQFRVNSGLFPLGADPNNGFQYQGDGSGAGRTAIIAGAPSSTTHSFESTSASVDFAGSDSAASRPNLAGINSTTTASGACAPNAYCYTATGTGGGPADGPLLQVPLFVAPIAITTHFTSGLLNRNGRLQFTGAQLCGIFSGKIQSWSDPALGGILVGSGTAPSGQIHVIYRADSLGSGTSSALTTYLAGLSASGVCTTGSSGNSNISFKSTSTFASLFSGGVVPSNFYGYDGSNGISNAVVNGGTSISQGGGAGNGDPGTNDNIGYVSADWTLIAPANSGQTSSIPPAQNVVNGGTSYAPNPTNALAALASITGTGTNAPGNASDLLTYGTNPGNLGLPAVPSTGYPISVYTYAIFPQCFAGDALSQSVYAGLLDYLTFVYTTPGAALVVGSYGFGTIGDPLFTAVENIINDTPANPAVGFQDSSVCTGTTASASGTTPGTASGRVAHN